MADMHSTPMYLRYTSVPLYQYTLVPVYLHQCHSSDRMRKSSTEGMSRSREPRPEHFDPGSRHTRFSINKDPVKKFLEGAGERKERRRRLQATLTELHKEAHLQPAGKYHWIVIIIIMKGLNEC